MHNQSDYASKQQSLFKEATQLASNGEECGHLVRLLDPEFTFLLRTFVRDLPESIRNQSIFGKANPPLYTKSKKK